MRSRSAPRLYRARGPWGAGLSAPENTVAPTISGDTDVGSTLTRDQGTWTGSPTPILTDQWTRDNVDIPGATGSTYETTDDDFGKAIRVKVTGTNSEGSDTATSSNSITVTDGDVLLDATFASDDEGFTNGTRVAEEGWDFETGYLSIAGSASGVGVALSEAPTTGVHRMDFSVQVGSECPDTFIYALPTSGSIASTNSLGNIRIRDAGTGQIDLSYGSGAAYTEALDVARNGWVKVSMVFDLDNTTFDLYIADLLWQRGIAFANGSAADFARVAIVSQAGSGATLFDAIRVTKDWTLASENVLVSDDFTVGTAEIEDSQPATDGVNVNKQNWHIPVLSGKGAFTRSANGLVPDANAACSALYRCGGEGVYEWTFTASAADGIYGGGNIRSWGGEDGGDSSVIFRYWDGSANPLLLRHDGANAATGSLSGTTITAGNDWTLKIEARGRYVWCYINDVLQFGGPVLLGQRGIMGEPHAGPFVDTATGSQDAGTDNYCKDFTYTGRLLTHRRQKTVGDWTILVEAGKVSEAYNSQLAAATVNLGWSGGIAQFGHLSEHDMMPYRPEGRTVYNTDNLLVIQQRAPCLSEGEGAGHGDCYLTVRRDQLWIDDRVFVGSLGYSYAPDIDLREGEWSRTFRHIGTTGASSEVVKSLESGFQFRASDVAPPNGHQALTDPASGDKIRLTHLVRNNLNASGGVWQRADKLEGVGDPLSLQIGLGETEVSEDTSYVSGRRVLLERGSFSLDDTVFQALRDDIKTPMTPTASVGSLKTDADGDLDTDGFNERFGWAEITCDGSGHATFTIDGATTARYYPAVRLNGFTAGGSITGLTEGVDYLLDDLGDGNALVQILSVVSASTEYAYTTA